MPRRNLNEMFTAADIHEMLPHERIVFFAVAAEAGRRQGDAQLEAVSRKDLGIAYRAEHRYEEALESWRESLRLFESLQDVQGQAKVLDDLGTTSTSLSDFGLAQDYYMRGLQLSVAADLTELQDMMMSHLMAMLSYEQRHLGDRPAASYVQLEKFAKEYGLADLTDAAGRILGRVAATEDQHSWWPYDTSEISASRLNDLAIQYLAADQSLRAIRIFQRMLRRYPEDSDESGVNALLYSIGDAYREIGLWEDAVNYLSQALAGYQARSNHQMEARIAYYLAAIHRELRDTESALRYARLAVDARRPAAEPETENRAVLASALFDAGHPQGARAELAECLNMLGSVQGSDRYLRGAVSDLMDELAMAWQVEIRADRRELAVELGHYLRAQGDSPGPGPPDRRTDPATDRTLYDLATIWSTPMTGEERWGWKHHPKGNP